LALTVTPALAAGKKAQSRQPQERAARKACLSGDYTKGVAILSELFVDTKDPTYLFNQGRCFEQNHRYEDALSRFEEYLRAAQGTLDAADQAAAEKHIADCKDRLPPDQLNKAQASAPQPFVPPPPTPAAPPEPSSTPQQSTSIAAQPEAQPTHSGAGLRVAGIVTASVGVAAAVAGVLLNLKVNSMVKDMDTTVGNYESRNSDRKTYQTMAWIGYGAGAACVVTGAILYGFGLRASRRSSTGVALLPAIGPGQAGALLTGAF
jgi:pyruvate/2-oxoglutarate dehydrogenase complex dihydrolipoamide acyltransferase (E2) component